MKAEKGDLIRIVSLDNGRGAAEAFDSGYSIGDILEVDSVSGKVTITKNECYLFGHEYEIHRKAGEEDSPKSKRDCFDIIREGLALQGNVIKGDVNADSPNMVDSPSHYTQGRYEVIDIIEDAVEGATAFEAVCQANILKYALRYRAKNGVEDLKKAQWYMARLIKHLDEMF